MDIKRIVEQAKAGDSSSFEKLVDLYQVKIYGFAFSRLKREAESLDVVQETWIKAFIHLKKLNNTEAFGSWLFSICRNTITGFYRKSENEDEMISCDDLATPEKELLEEWEHYHEYIKLAFHFLNRNEQEIIHLKYYSCLSYREIAVLLEIPSGLVKSRLYEAREKLRKILPNLYEGISLSPHKQYKIKEWIMEKIDLIKKAAKVIRKLSFNHQMQLCQIIQRGEKFPEELLAEIGKIKDGKEVVAGYQAKMTLFELINIFYYDRGLENWLVDNLESENPGLAEQIKENMFVFEDIIFADSEVIQKLFENSCEEMLVAITICPANVKEHMLSGFSDEEQKDLLLKTKNYNTTLSRVYEAQFSIIEIIKEWEEKRIIEVLRSDCENGFPVVRFVK